jgi:peptidylprolyl isomerase
MQPGSHAERREALTRKRARARQVPLGCPPVSYFNDFHTFRTRTGPGLATLGAAILIAGCGSSGSSTITIGNENKADNALVTESTPASTTPTTTTATAKTPTSGPLSKEPTVTPPKGAPPTKLVTKELITGTGTEAKDGDTVTVNDVGVLYSNGKQFENSFKREPFTFALGKGQVIPGWEQGVPGMKVGGRRELIIPPALAYGAKGSPPNIPPNETLVFVIDLLGA